MKAQEWKRVLGERGVDGCIIELVCAMAEERGLEPPTTETKQLLIALEKDGNRRSACARRVLAVRPERDLS
jgi:hypothetical protein